MLTSTSIAVNKSSRIVTLRHANSILVSVTRKHVLREELDGDGNPMEMGGAPTLGGMGVLRSEDEAEYEYAPMGEARMLYAAPFSPMDMNDQGNGTVTELQREATIECVLDPEDAGFFEVEKDDLLMADMGFGFILTYEVTGIASPSNIPPYTRRYTLNPRDDLNYMDPPFGA